MNDALKNEIESQCTQELQNASHHATRWTIYLRVLENVANLLQMSFSDVADTIKRVKIHPDVVARLEMAFPEGDVILLATKDFHKRSELVKCLEAARKKKPHVIDAALAIDGFGGNEINHHLYALAVGSILREEDSFKNIHVRAVRKLYDRTTPDKIHDIIQKAFDGFDHEPDVQFYIEQVGRHLKDIATWRKASVVVETEINGEINNETSGSLTTGGSKKRTKKRTTEGKNKKTKIIEPNKVEEKNMEVLNS